MKRLSEEIIDSSIKIHKALGPGLLESVYQGCLFYELENKKIPVEREVVLPVTYETITFENAYRADLLVDNKIIIELKSVDNLQPIHRAQTLTYLKLSKCPLALLINFGAPLLKDGLQRFVNGQAGNDL